MGIAVFWAVSHAKLLTWQSFCFKNWRQGQSLSSLSVLIDFFSSTAKDLGSLHVLLQLFHQPAGLRFHGQQLQKGLQAHLPCHVSVAHEAKGQGGKHGCTGRGRDGSPGTQRRSRVALSFIWILKAKLRIRTLCTHCLFIVCAGDESSLPTLAYLCIDLHTHTGSGQRRVCLFVQKWCSLR